LLDPRHHPQLDAAIEALVKQGTLDRGAPAYGVALAAIANGYEGLTRAQKGLFDRVLAPALITLDAPPQEREPPSIDEAPPTAPEATAWKPVREAPDDRDVQLGIKDSSGINALAFASRRSGRSWIRSEDGKPLPFRPTHWREWLPSRD